MKTAIEHPILFSASMVRALLNGSKTQTRRVVKPQPALETTRWCFGGGMWMAEGPSDATGGMRQTQGWKACPYGQPGDKLWVRESWQLHSTATDLATVVYAASSRQSWTEMHRLFPVEQASGLVAKPFQEGWRPSIHMPRWASRILLEIVDVRVERLQDISEADAAAEGAPVHFKSSRDNFCALWQQINGDSSWDVNPWVWVIEFKQVRGE
ncbi:hypothetical protein [Aquitalea pelogenes]|uniref:hypothetical protein n=1 Tax=Aquitalea pelogenes TaxID=1293573 RepID=UPI000788F155|nr:hypothetical protein [Aquitalea pelogenes]